MTDYQAPVRQMRFTIEHLADFPAVAALPDFASVDGDTVDAVLEEAAKFAGTVLAPINWLGDRQGVAGGRRRRAGAAGIHRRLPAVLRGGLAGHRVESRIRRPGLPEDRRPGVRRDVGGGQRRVRAVPRTVAGRDPRHGPPRHLALLVVLGSKNEPVVAGQTEKVQVRTLTQTVLATGKIYPEIQVLISPEVSGEIIELPVKEGMKVSRGDLLMRIKPDIYMAARDRAAGGVASTQARLAQGEGEYKRAKELFQKGLISESELESAQTTFETRRAFYDQAKASLDQANEDLHKTTVYAPMAGTISALSVELGEGVLGTQQLQGTQVMTVADLSNMEARVDVGENDAPRHQRL